MEAEQDAIRKHLAELLAMLRQHQSQAGHSEKGRALSVAITQLEIASMCIIRSFFADEPYSPLNKLKPVNA